MIGRYHTINDEVEDRKLLRKDLRSGLTGVKDVTVEVQSGSTSRRRQAMGAVDDRVARHLGLTCSPKGNVDDQARGSWSIQAK